MTKSLIKLFILVAILTVPFIAIAGDKKADGTLAAQIEQKMVGVAPNTVIIVVDDATNTAFLRGTVSSQAEADRITGMLQEISDVRVIGSTLKVDATTMQQPMTTATTTVDPAEDDQPTTFEEETATTTITTSDASLKAAVEEALKSEGIIGQSKIRVETEGGVVTLTGAALSESQADRIVALAQSVPGVVSVQPNITLRDGKRRYQIKPDDDRDKQGFEPGDAESRTENEDEDEDR